jgi:hypothetical protein
VRVVLKILMRARRSGKGLVLLTQLAFGWTGAEEAAPSRRDIVGRRPGTCRKYLDWHRQKIFIA